ncbi:MAG TPA: 3-hydroxyacyl-CoA dehydrogenase NAD-binding domain-containing protein [Melioribacteraceae bacterium]|nr:3-hydroxyacyl-CoA dehydrogenase NAD-binding domain-containing protein [Melioribacteraceae bacterium]
MKKIAVIGAGTMGNGIAHVFAQFCFPVQLIDLNESILTHAFNTISKNLDRQVKKEIIDINTKNNILSNISLKSNIDSIDFDTDLVIEAIVEKKDAKILLFNKLDSLINKDSIFATNTSAISITELQISNRPDKFIGMHFMNPVPVMKLVELIKGYLTSDETFNKINSLVYQLNKEPVLVNDSPGFISNRVLMPMINEAIFALYENVASVKDIDSVMKLGMNHPMGPLQLADFIGLDVCLDIMNVLFSGFNDPKYRPCPLLKKMVAANKLGKKSGEGFYKY